MMPTNFYWNIKSHRQYNEYMKKRAPEISQVMEVTRTVQEEWT